MDLINRSGGKRVARAPPGSGHQQNNDQYERGPTQASGAEPQPSDLSLAMRTTSSSIATVKTSSSATRSLLTASSTSELPHLQSTSSEYGRPSSSRRRSEAWDHQLLLAAQEPADDVSDTASETENFWPKTESDSSEDDAPTTAASAGPVPKRSGTKSGSKMGSKPGGSSSAKFFRHLMKRFGISYKRYGSIPYTKEEQDRNMLQHKIISELFEGKFHLAPVTRPRRVLDVGTGPGLWALEYGKSLGQLAHKPFLTSVLAQSNPATAVLGVDIETTRPPYKAPNCRFLTMDVTEPWELETKFDLIHVRMLGDVTGKPQLLQSIYDNLNPGGWVELTEWVVRLHSPNHSFQGTAFHRWNRLLYRGLHTLGSSVSYPYKYRSMLEATGFERVTETKNAAPTNACYPGKSLQRVGAMMTNNWLAIIEPLTLPVFTGALGWSPEQTHALLADVRQEIGDPKYHSYMTLLTVYGRKPKDGSSATSISGSASSSSVHMTGQGAAAVQPPA